MLARTRGSRDDRRRPVGEEVEDRESTRKHRAGEPQRSDLRPPEMANDRRIHQHVNGLRGQRPECREGEAQDLAVMRRAEAHRATIMAPMKVGIIVPYSWSFWGGVVEHAELQAEALTKLGCDVRTIMGNDPPGQFTRVLHPRHGRHGTPPPEVIPIGRSVIVPANGTLPNIILSPRSVFRIKHALERERFDVLHLHEPMTPTPCIATLAMSTAPMVGTFHANGDLGWMRFAKPIWGFLAERLDHRIAVSERARESAYRWLPGDYEIVPNGVLIPSGRRARRPSEPHGLRRPARGT